MNDDPDFFAWLDGELAEPQASAMARKVAGDPELAAFAEQHRALGARLTTAFAPLVSERVPDRLRTAVTPPPPSNVVDFAAARERRFGRWSLTGLAVAASLALGLTIGTLLPREGDELFRGSGGQLAAAGTLDDALNRQLASAGDRAGIRIGVSFRDQAGRYCRTFTAQASSGLACRSGDDWSVEGLIRAERPNGDYRMASGQDPALGALIDSRIAGEPLDPDAEARIARQGWRD